MLKRASNQRSPEIESAQHRPGAFHTTTMNLINNNPAACYSQGATCHDLSTLKADEKPLCSILGVERSSNHARCPSCGNRSLSIFQGTDGWACHCKHAGCDLAGDVISILARLERLTPAEAIRRLTGSEYRPGPRKPAPVIHQRQPVAPVPDLARFRRLQNAAVENILEGRADKWLAHRGINKEFVGKHPILGFIERASIAGWSRPLVNSWLIFVLDADGTPRAVKAHREHITSGPKSLWLPLGTTPRHGYATLWPAPEWLPTDETIFVAEGELKAAAILSADRAAIAPTSGAGFKWTSEHVARLAGRRVVVVFDDDDAGHTFRDNTIAALRGHVAGIGVHTFGQRAVA